jgi:phosphatidylserine/phosphatidylglycerophosphate/cardiolipin synthase-like enzyme
MALFFPSKPELEARANGTQMDTLDIFCKWLQSATSALDICVFNITNSAITRSILEVHRKGVRVRVVTDDDQVMSTGSKVKELTVAGIEVLSVLLFTVTFHASHAHNLTRSP